MSQLRKDPVTGRWVIVNIEEPKTTSDYVLIPQVKSSRVCPFCPGNESMTPPEIHVYGRKPGSKSVSNWLVRVIPNKFPALRIEEGTEKVGVGIYDKLGGFGAHEVIIENPDHDKEIPDLPDEHVELVLQAFKDRCLDLRKDPRFKYIVLFKNYGARAGASQEHPHSQLIALPIVPSRVQDEVRGSVRQYAYSERCIYCDMINQEKNDKKLSIFQNEDFLVFEPFVSRFPFETWILPKVHDANFDNLSAEKIKSLAKALQITLSKLKHALNDAPYNLMIHTLPLQGVERESYHWHIEIIPHLTHIAGFEMGTGFYMNATPPEVAAKILRDAL